MPPDPASDARLADYEAAYIAASKVTAAGARCEQVANAYSALSADDLRRGRSITLSAASRLKALGDGEVCRTAISQSNQHFTALAQAVAAATQPNASLQAMQAAADAPKVLDGFDQSRTRRDTDSGLVTRAQGFAADLSASDARIRKLTTTADAYQAAQSPGLALQAADAEGQLTSFDRSRLTGPQQASLTAAREAARLVQDSRSRLSRLSRLLAAAQANPVTDTEEKLIDGVASITPFDNSIATSDQRQTLEQAGTTASTYAWRIARQRVAALGSDERADPLQAASSIYKVLKDVPQDKLSAEQRQILVKLQGAVDALAASDGRLRALNEAYLAWQQRGFAAGDSVTDSMRAVTALDRSRFGEGERKVIAALAKADQIVRGPEIGFTVETKARLPIFVQPISDSAVDGRTSVSLANALRRAGFSVAATASDAALTLSVGFNGSDGLKQDLSSGFFAWVTTVRAAYSLAWNADGSVLLSGEVTQPGRSQDQTTVQSQALLADIDEIVTKIQAKAGK